MSRYDNDPRVRPDPIVGGGYWLVERGRLLFNVVEGDDGVYRAFALETPQPATRRMLGDLLEQVPAGDFESVVHYLIGDPE